MTGSSWPGACVAALLIACAPADPPIHATDARAGLRAPAEATAPAPAGTRGHLRGGEPVERVIDWPTQAPVALAEPISRAIAESPVPVLVPPGPWREALTVIPLGAAGFSLRARHLRTKIVVQGSRIARLHEGLGAAPGDRRIRGVDGHLTANEGIRSASWIEGGAAYSADLECGDPRAPECASDEGFLALLEALVYGGGDRPTIGGAP